MDSSYIRSSKQNSPSYLLQFPPAVKQPPSKQQPPVSQQHPPQGSVKAHAAKMLTMPAPNRAMPVVMPLAIPQLSTNPHNPYGPNGVTALVLPFVPVVSGMKGDSRNIFTDPGSKSAERTEDDEDGLITVSLQPHQHEHGGHSDA